MTFFEKSDIIRNMGRQIIRNFIVLEGIDGSGTTTLQKTVSRQLSQMNIPHRCDAEPTDSTVGRRIRAMLKSGNPADPLFNTAIGALFSLDRAIHLYGQNGITETVKKDCLVLCDRYLFSTAAYQGLDGNREDILSMNETFPLPEYLFFLDLPVRTAMERIEKRGNPKEVYETVSYLERIAKSYRDVIDSFTGSGMKIITLDATLAPEILKDRLLDSLVLKTE